MIGGAKPSKLVELLKQLAAGGIYLFGIDAGDGIRELPLAGGGGAGADLQRGLGVQSRDNSGNREKFAR